MLDSLECLVSQENPVLTISTFSRHLRVDVDQMEMQDHKDHEETAGRRDGRAHLVELVVLDHEDHLVILEIEGSPELEEVRPVQKDIRVEITSGLGNKVSVESLAQLVHKANPEKMENPEDKKESPVEWEDPVSLDSQANEVNLAPMETPPLESTDFQVQMDGMEGRENAERGEGTDSMDLEKVPVVTLAIPEKEIREKKDNPEWQQQETESRDLKVSQGSPSFLDLRTVNKVSVEMTVNKENPEMRENGSL